MKLTTLLNSSLIKLELNSDNKSDVLEELVDLMVEENKVSDRDAFLKAVMAREGICTTGIGRGIQDGYTTPSVIDQGIQSAQAQTTAENIAHDQHLKNLNVENPQFIQKIASDLSGNIEQAVKSDGAVMDRKIYK